MKKILTIVSFALLSVIILHSCKKDEKDNAKNPDTAERVSVDRFSAAAGNLMVRDASNGLPAANAAINFDNPPFITKGFKPTGTSQIVKYYNFDVMSTTPAPIWVFFKAGATTPVAGQLNIIDKIPGEANYNDFWIVNKVIVPDDYVANTVTSYAGVIAKGFTVKPTTMIVNCLVVPDGSIATKRVGGGSAALIRSWYKDKLAFYFSFEEKALNGTSVPTSAIYVAFNINPDLTNGGPPSGFKVEMGTVQTHNVLATLSSDALYSPLWSVNIYDNASFASVNNLSTAQAAPQKVIGAALVNCPVAVE